MHQHNLSGIDKLYMCFTLATHRGVWERQPQTTAMKEEQIHQQSGGSLLNHPGLQPQLSAFRDVLVKI